MTRRDRTTSEVLGHPNAMHADLMEHLRDVAHQLQSNAAAMDRHRRVMNRVARRIADLECAVDR